MENCELIQMLLEQKQPHAVVEVQAKVTCYETHEPEGGYSNFSIALKVVRVHSTLGKIVLEVVE